MNEETIKRSGDSIELGGLKVQEGLQLFEVTACTWDDGRTDGAQMARLSLMVGEALDNPESVGAIKKETLWIQPAATWSVQKAVDFFGVMGVMPDRENFPLTFFADMVVRETISKKIIGAKIGIDIYKKEKVIEGETRMVPEISGFMTMKEYRAKCNSGGSAPAETDGAEEVKGEVNPW